MFCFASGGYILNDASNWRQEAAKLEQRDPLTDSDLMWMQSYHRTENMERTMGLGFIGLGGLLLVWNGLDLASRCKQEKKKDSLDKQLEGNL